MQLKNVLPTIAVIMLASVGSFFVSLNYRSHQAANDNQRGGITQAQAFILPLAEANYLPIRNFNLPEPELDAKAAALFDVNAEKFLYARNSDQKLPIASITKLMTAVVIMENLPLNTEYRVAAEDINVDGKGADLYKDERLRGSDLLKIMLIKSSNDAALTFANNATGRGVDLIAKMNEKAQTLGMFNTKFADSAGLSDNDSFSTAGDLIKLARYVGKYPIIWETLVTRSADVSSVDSRFQHHLINTNRLLTEMSDIVGGKTGYTDGALETMLLVVSINGGRDRLISVILGSNDRFTATRKLIDWGLNAYYW